MEQSEYTGEKEIKIKRGRVDSLSLYEITDYELDILEKGSPSSIYLNFSIFLLSVAISFLIALFTSNIQSDRIFAVFVVIICVGFSIGFLLLILWFRNRTSLLKMVDKIKNRIPKDIIASNNEQAESHH